MACLPAKGYMYINARHGAKLQPFNHIKIKPAGVAPAGFKPKSQKTKIIMV
jgi:hypothetical protein